MEKVAVERIMVLVWREKNTKTGKERSDGRKR